MIFKLLTLSGIVFLAAPPFFHPDAPVTCRKYLPGTNTEVTPGVIYRYSPQEWRNNQMKCYCSTVLPLERLCIQGGYGKRRCEQRTSRWIEENFPIAPGGAQNQSPGQGATRRQNFILNIQGYP